MLLCALWRYYLFAWRNYVNNTPYNTRPQKLFRFVRHCYCCDFVYIYISIAPLFWAFMHTRVRLGSNFDNVLYIVSSDYNSVQLCNSSTTAADDGTERNPTTTTVIAATARRSGPVVTPQSWLVSRSVVVGWSWAYRTPQSTRNTQHAFLFYHDE